MPASTSGFTRIEIGALHAIFSATAASNRSSGSDSTLKHLIPASRARCISLAVLPTPENTTLPASPPAAMTRSNSPTDTTSKPAPKVASVRRIAKFELAFTA